MRKEKNTIKIKKRKKRKKMNKIILLLVTCLITSCTVYDGALNKLKNLDKAKCYDKETNTIKIGCK